MKRVLKPERNQKRRLVLTNVFFFFFDNKLTSVFIFSRHRYRSPSPHSVKSSQLKNKLNDTSFFAELIKDRQKREQELKKLETMWMEKRDETQEKPPTMPSTTSTTTTVTTTNSTPKNDEKNDKTWTPVSVDVVDIPIPSESTADTPPKENCVPVNNIPTPNIPVPPENSVATTRSLTPTASAPIPTIPLQPPVPTAPLPAPIPSVSQAVNVANKKSVPEPPKPAKPKVTKLPMPPGIKQADLEAIESPPSRTPSPAPVPITKPKTPPRKSGIMNLPMPPGNCCDKNYAFAVI